jgi:hypothetical protein
MKKTTHFLKRILAFAMTGVMSFGMYPFNTQAASQQLQLVRAAAEEQAVYVLMNIPYADFYKAEVRNDKQVDAFSSATLNKTRTGTLVAGSYHVDKEGSDITGITYPVKVGAGVDLSGYKKVTDSDSVTISVTNRGQTSETTYEGSDALFESDSYSYYVLNGTPSYYKEVTKNADGSLAFGKAVGTVNSSKKVTAEFSTESSYGDYELDLNADELGLADDENVNAVVISTDDHDYGLRHMENIWQKVKLSWCTGFTENVHNCPTSSEHYASMMGETIRKVTYYTTKGIYEVSLDQDVYVPKKFASELNVQNALVSAGTTEVNISGLPSDYQAVYSVEGLTDAKVSDGKLTYRAAVAKNGQYTLKVTDMGNVYASLSTSFELYADTIPVKYDETNNALVAASGSTAEDVSSYIKNIASVSVNGSSYAASGHGAVTIINEDGTIKTDAEPVLEAGTYEMEISATGYQPLKFTYVKSDDQQSGTGSSETGSSDSQSPETTEPSGSQSSSDDNSEASTQPEETAVTKGSTYSEGNLNYKVTSADSSKRTVTVISPKNKKVTSIIIPAAVTIQNQSYKVTAVADNAFANCKKLKKAVIGKNVTSLGKNVFKADSKLTAITIQSAKLKKVGSGALKGIHENAKIKVPSAEWKNYKKLLKGKGQGNKVKIVK